MVSSHDLPADLDALVRDELAPGERILYAERPLAGRSVLGAFATWLFAVPWTAFALFWMFAASGGLSGDRPSGVGLVFPLFGLPFVLVGLAMLAAPLKAWHAARRSLCVVTDRRALVFGGAGFRAIHVHTFSRSELAAPQRTERPDGSGDLLFVPDVRLDGGPTLRADGFRNVPDVRGAERAVRALTGADEPDPEPDRRSGRRRVR